MGERHSLKRGTTVGRACALKQRRRTVRQLGRADSGGSTSPKRLQTGGTLPPRESSRSRSWIRSGKCLLTRCQRELSKSGLGVGGQTSGCVIRGITLELKTTDPFSSSERTARTTG